MTGRHKLIEQKLKVINSADFQALGDSYLLLKERNLIFSSGMMGSQFGESKTTPGTPDTYFRYVDGNFHCIEYTTQKRGIVAKIKNDIDACLNINLMGIPASDISSIIICFNSELTPKQEKDVYNYSFSKKIRIRLIDIKLLSKELLFQFPIIAKEFLEIPFDTGQLITLQTFINEYTNKANALSTPLDNIFLNRENELVDIENYLKDRNILILSGAAGVGKTKLALEFANNFLKANSDYTSYVISNKDRDITDDLEILLSRDGNYLLLIDDANRQLPNFKKVLGTYKEVRKGNFKLIVTVRDYALDEVKNEFGEFEYEVKPIAKFTDDEIKKIISSDSFKINHHKYQNKIIELSDGNARLAIMGARLANTKQYAFLKGEVTDLFDYYFKSFIKDFDIFKDKNIVKTMGIISFFYSIDLNRKELILKILSDFDLKEDKFYDAVNLLQKKELLDINWQVVRVSEQIMATYFFFRVFLKDEMLSIKALLFKYYCYEWKSRFRESIISANNLFYFNNEEILLRLNLVLDEYYNSIINDEKKVFEYFDLFWFYKIEDVLGYFLSTIKKLPEPINPTYENKKEDNYNELKTDRTLDFISQIFKHNTQQFTPSIQLAFEYVRKMPNKLPELIHKIREHVSYTDDDEEIGFARQIKLMDYVIEEFNNSKPHVTPAFFSLSKTFLTHQARVTKGGRKMSIVFYDYPVSFEESIKQLRERIWKTIFNSFDIYPTQVLSIISNYNPGYPKANKDMLKQDLTFILPFIETRLDASIFENCYLVQNLVNTLNRLEIDDRNYQKFKHKFRNKTFDYYRKLDWNRLRNKEEYDYKNRDEFERQKENEIRKFFIFNSINEVDFFLNVIQEILNLKKYEEYHLRLSLDIIVEENYTQNKILGFQILTKIMDWYPIGLNPFQKTITKIISESKESAHNLWEKILDWENEYCIYWKQTFLDILPKDYVDETYCMEILKMFNTVDRGIYVDFSCYDKFKLVNKNIHTEILKILVGKLEFEKLPIDLGYHFFKNYSKYFKKEFKLLAKVYYLQVENLRRFDYHSESLKALVDIKPAFFIEYLNHLLKKDTISHSDSHDEYSFVWNWDDKDKLIEKALNLAIDKAKYSYREHLIHNFFIHLKPAQKEKAEDFIIFYISKYNADSKKMQSIVDVLRVEMGYFFEKAFIKYLEVNTDEKDFEKINWRGNNIRVLYNATESSGIIESNEYNAMLEILEKMPNQLEFLGIKVLLLKYKHEGLAYAEIEKKRRFINPK